LRFNRIHDTGNHALMCPLHGARDKALGTLFFLHLSAGRAGKISGGRFVSVRSFGPAAGASRDTATDFMAQREPGEILRAHGGSRNSSGCLLQVLLRASANAYPAEVCHP
jgi:hypothetical protein